jgi:hypothetical protein
LATPPQGFLLLAVLAERLLTGLYGIGGEAPVLLEVLEPSEVRSRRKVSWLFSLA